MKTMCKISTPKYMHNNYIPKIEKKGRGVFPYKFTLYDL